MTANYPPGFSYPDFANSFTAELWNPQQWAELFAQVRRFYMIALFLALMLSRAVWCEVCRADVQAPRGIAQLFDCNLCPTPLHRSQGFTNWPSSVSWNWNSVVCISLSWVRRIGSSLLDSSSDYWPSPRSCRRAHYRRARPEPHHGPLPQHVWTMRPVAFFWPSHHTFC